MLQVLQQLQLAVGTLRQDGRAEGLHDFLHRHRLRCELVFGRAFVDGQSMFSSCFRTPTHHTSPKAPMPTGWRSVYLLYHQLPCPPYLVGGRAVSAPAGDLKGRAKDLRTHEFGHLDGVSCRYRSSRVLYSLVVRWGYRGRRMEGCGAMFLRLLALVGQGSNVRAFEMRPRKQGLGFVKVAMFRTCAWPFAVLLERQIPPTAAAEDLRFARRLAVHC